MADVVLSVTIKDAHVTRVLNCINGQANKFCNMRIDNGSIITWSKNAFSYEEKQAGETNKQFAERVLRKLLVEFVKHFEYNADVVRFNNDVNTLVKPDVNVPDDILI